MKTVKSKKFHTWKYKWKRKKRTRNSCAWHNKTPNKSFTKHYIRAERALNKRALYEIIKGAEEEEVKFKYNHRHSAWWDWW